MAGSLKYNLQISTADQRILALRIEEFIQGIVRLSQRPQHQTSWTGVISVNPVLRELEMQDDLLRCRVT